MKIIKSIIRRLWFFQFGYQKFGKHSFVSQRHSFYGKKYICIENYVNIEKGARIECYKKYFNHIMNPLIHIKKSVCIKENFTALVADELTIGENTLIASNVFISTENHGMNPEIPYYEQPLTTKPVHIGSNCWIGEKVVILPGVTIGDYSIIGAGSIVTKNIPPYTIAAGNPAKAIKKWDAKNKECVKI